MVNAVNQAALTSMSIISGYAQVNSGTVPTAENFSQVGVTGITSMAVLNAVNSVLSGTPINGDLANSTAELQSIVNVYNTILTGADNTLDADVTLNAAQYAQIGLSQLNSASEVSLMNNVLDQSLLSEVDSYSKLSS
jgi:hypothetical protein